MQLEGAGESRTAAVAPTMFNACENEKQVASERAAARRGERTRCLQRRMNALAEAAAASSLASQRANWRRTQNDVRHSPVLLTGRHQAAAAAGLLVLPPRQAFQVATQTSNSGGILPVCVSVFYASP